MGPLRLPESPRLPARPRQPRWRMAAATPRILLLSGQDFQPSECSVAVMFNSHAVVPPAFASSAQCLSKKSAVIRSRIEATWVFQSATGPGRVRYIIGAGRIRIQADCRAVGVEELAESSLSHGDQERTIPISHQTETTIKML